MITTLGIFLIPFIALTLVMRSSSFMYVATFFAPFTATSIFHMPSGVPITPFQFFAGLSILFWCVWLLIGKSGIEFKLSLSQIAFLTFLIAVICSSAMPLLIDGKLMISSNTLNDISYERLSFNSSRLKLLFPVLIGSMFAFVLASFLNSKQKVKLAVRVFAASGFFVAIWGLLQFLFQNVLGMEYPHYIFNNSMSKTMQGYLQMINIGGKEFYRISSVTHEPSIFAKNLLPVLALLFTCRAMGAVVFRSSVDVMMIMTILVALILSTSSIGYVGIILIFGLFFLTRTSEVRFGTRMAILLGSLSIVGMASVSILAQAFFTEIVLEKSQSGSFLERILSIETSFGYFLEYPFLGVGWANVTSHDLIMNLLVNTGIIGCVLFLFFVCVLVSKSRSRLKLTSNKKNNFAIHSGVLSGFLVVIICGVVSGLEFYNGGIYVLTGLLFALQRGFYDKRQ